MLLDLLDLSLRATAAAGAVGLVLMVLRVRSGRARHAAWSAVLVVMLTMPVLMKVVPEVGVGPWVPGSLGPWVRGSLGSWVPGSLSPWVRRSLGSWVPGSSSPWVPGSSRLAGVALEIDGDPAAGPAASRPGDSSERFTSGANAPSVDMGASSGRWTRVLMAIHGAVAMLFLLRLLRGWALARRVVRGASPVRLDSRARVFSSPALAAPVSVGILRPVIVLPDGWRRWDPFTLRAVLAHESAHVRRRDGLIALLAGVNRALFWCHPLAWWLERTIAVNAEHACDEIAVREAGDPRAYAQVLLDFAAHVQRGGRRVAWQALGVNGTGLLGRRIHRILHGDGLARLSLPRRILTASACAAVLVAVIACRQPFVAPLREDPEVAKRLAEEAEGSRQFQAAINLSLEEVDGLEARIATDPDDWDARRTLVTYYSAGTKVPWERKVSGLRRHALWLIEHHPTHEIAAPALSPQYDPEGFAEATRLWDAHLADKNAPPFLIYCAARFFAPYDKPAAERLILRGLERDPQSEDVRPHTPPNVVSYSWRSQLADLYASAIQGLASLAYRTPDPTVAGGGFAQEVRQKLETTTDADLLARVGSRLTRARDLEIAALADTYLQRALTLQPDLQLARDAVARMDSGRRHDRLWAAVTSGGTVPDADRLAYLADKIQYHYSRLEAADRQLRALAAGERVETRQGFVTREALETSAHEERQALESSADDALALASGRPGSPDAHEAVMAAHEALGLTALRNGDRRTAVRHLLASVEQAPPAPDGVTLGGAHTRLATYLLKEGERESVIRFLEAYAELNPNARDRLLEDAEAVREGRMTVSYQHIFGRPE